MNYSDKSMIDHAKHLYPLNRSLTGNGTRETLDYFEDLFPEFERLKFRTGKNVFDWKIPEEWNVVDAYIQHIETGRKYAEFKRLNIHLVGYSEPCDRYMELEELQPYLYTDDNIADAVPYVTSYYSRRWGFCISKNEKESLPKGKYHVFIDSSLKDGFLEMSHMAIEVICMSPVNAEQ